MHRTLVGAFLCIGMPCFSQAEIPTDQEQTVTIRLEAELAAEAEAYVVTPASSGADDWAAKKIEGASAGRVLTSEPIKRSNKEVKESKGIPFVVHEAGNYRVWVRYFKPREGYADFWVLLRDEHAEMLAFAQFDLIPRMPSSTPYIKADTKTGNKPGWRWESFPVILERPLEGTLTFGSDITHAGTPKLHRYIDCVIITNDMNIDPQLLSPEQLLAIEGNGELPVISAPEGFLIGQPFGYNTLFFSGADEYDDQFVFNMHMNLNKFADYSRLIQYGMTRSNNLWNISMDQGMPVEHMAVAWTQPKRYPDFFNAHANGNGFFVNQDGEISHSLFSFAYPPMREFSRQETKREVSELAENSGISHWVATGEQKGLFDYSPYAQQAFRDWLADEYQDDIERLNVRWATHYTDFKTIEAPVREEDNPAAYYDFVRFSGESFADFVGENVRTIRENDPKGRPILSKSSALMLLTPYFVSRFPFDFEEFINTAYADEGAFGYDNYDADDVAGMNFDLLQALGGERDIWQLEFNPHSADPRVQARTTWIELGKGLKGVGFFQASSSQDRQDPFKFAYQDLQFRPNAKLAAASDIMQQVHHLEPMMVQSRSVLSDKPVALLYSRQDIAQAQPNHSIWGGAVDNHAHVYSTLRSAGYEVTWITPKQINEGGLDTIGALVLTDVQHLPPETVRDIRQWVKGGGALIADRFPGALDPWGHPQDAFGDILGIQALNSSEPAETSNLAFEESPQGYGNMSEKVLHPTALEETIGEIWAQHDSQHPVIMGMRAPWPGMFNLGGTGFQHIRVVGGEIIGMAKGEMPGIVANTFGEGHTLYFACMMGSLHDGSATLEGADSTTSGLAYVELLKSFLTWAGVEPYFTTNISYPRVAAKLRVEAPLIDGAGNSLIFLSSLNDQPLQPFDLSLRLPKTAQDFRHTYALVNGSRQLIPIKSDLKGDRLHIAVPSFDTHATLLLANDIGPLVSLKVDLPRSPVGNIGIAQPGETFKVEAQVFNLSDRPCPLGSLKLYVPAGWYQDTWDISLSAISPWEASPCETFQVRTPDVHAMRLLRPILVRYANAEQRSTPATEMLWWVNDELETQERP